MKYFKDYFEDSKFAKQSDLAEALKTLDSQYSELIESDEINPLTIRLFNVSEALKGIENFINKLKPPSSLPDNIKDVYIGGDPITSELCLGQPSSGCAEYFRVIISDPTDWKKDPFDIKLPPSLKFEQADDGRVRLIITDPPISTFYLHTHIYNFFTNAYSVLDRIRLELNSIYFDGTIKLKGSGGNKYWKDYTESSNSKINELERNGFKKLTSILTGGLAKSLTEGTDNHKGIDVYRNRLNHDGYLEININTLGKVYLPKDPLLQSPDFDEELLPYIERAFLDLQQLLHDIYEQIIIDLKGNKRIPLVTKT